MFIIDLKYIEPIEEIDHYLAAHRAYLDEGYQKNYFVASGPKNPRLGGIIISQLKDKDELEKFLRNDPFLTHHLATYSIIEFNPIKFHEKFREFV